MTTTQNVLQWSVPGGDIAQTSLWVEYGGTPTAAQALARFQTNVVDTIWPSGAGGIKSNYEGTTILTQVQTRIIEFATGRVQSVASAAYTRAGSGTGNPCPPEVAMCVSLRTARAGASYRGRMYLPAPRIAVVNSTGKIDSTALSAMVTTIAGALTAMNADVTYTSAAVQVRSRLHNTQEDVTSIDMGDVFDAQRRRRNSTGESRTSASV